MQRFYILLFFNIIFIKITAQNNAFQIGFERDSNSTATYFETIEFYEKLAKAYPKQLKLTTQGMTDAGFPLHVAVLSKDGDFDPASIRKKNKRILFVNNAIHPGEPTGVDATMMLYRDYLQNKNPASELNNVVIIVIPFYNIGGGLNRGGYSRANQNGPKAYGFRGNAKNLDLNRDFIKADSKNAQTFNQTYNNWQPDVFIDNHISNGADYPYTMTLIAGQKDKLDPNLGAFMQDKLLPALYDGMKKSGWEMTPYVNAFGDPTRGIAGFLDLPRFGSGYAALHNALPFIAEAHMLKPYKDQVQSTYTLMRLLIQFMNNNAQAIKEVRNKAIENSKTKKEFALNWQLDRTKKDSLLFKGYEAKQKPSEISGLDRLYYDRNASYEKYVPYYNTYNATLSVEKPIAYIIPQAYTDVIDRLKWNNVQMQRLQQDVNTEVELYYIKDYKTGTRPYEGHYLHNSVMVDKKVMNWTYHKGDYVIYVNQPVNRYIVETLEPQGVDSYFAWNFFDAILQQKEHFSDYVFEDLAAEYLKQHPDLQQQLNEKRAADPEFAKSGEAQLEFIYQNSPYYEKTHNLYPVGRLVKDVKLPVK
ncbi:MAG: M14 family zinc carboxypeptidase [Saprospiraceae bacterium]